MTTRSRIVGGVFVGLGVVLFLVGITSLALSQFEGSSGATGGGSSPELSAMAPLAPWVPLAPLASPNAGPTVRFGADLTIPWALGGPRVERDGTLRDYPGQWPTIPVRSVRFWDSRTAWLNLEPAPDTWDFTRLDGLVLLAESRGVDRITLVLGGTPRWAAAQERSTDAFWLGPGSASPPRDLADWAQFVAVVAERYRGRIDAYEIWNEPTTAAFWSGSRAQWADLVASAAREIRRIDPDARVVAPGIAVTSARDVTRMRPWLAELADRSALITDISVHFYPRTVAQARTLGTLVRSLRSLAGTVGLPASIWVTEVNLVGGARLPAAQQRDVIASITSQARRAGVGALTWYAWTDLTSPELIQFQPRTPGARELARQIRLEADR